MKTTICFARAVVCLALIASGWHARPAAAYGACQTKFLAAMAAAGKNGSAGGYVDFVDPDTPDASCTVALCQGDWDACNPLTHNAKEGGSPVVTQDLVLVFSDEFEQQERSFGVAARDRRWTAQDMYYFPTHDIEVYKPEQVITWNGKAIITLEKLTRPESAVSLQPDGKKWNVAKNFKSGMMSGWNKWCYTGGYLEMSVKLPGNDKVPGLWPAFWAMGNLGRAGFMPSTNGLWPYSFDACANGTTQANSVPGSEVPSQLVTACPSNVSAPDYINRTKYDLKEGQARNAPEFDVFEIIVNEGTGSLASQTLQMAPLLPLGQSWADLGWYAKNGYTPEGVQYPGGISGLRTEGNQWSGSYGRPGNGYQDSMSAESHLDASFYEGYHTFGVDWAPGEYMRWYVDGIFAYEINPNALVARTGPGPDGIDITIGERMIPLEPMYVIFNLGMSESFGTVDLENLAFPSYMMVDYIRVYQRADKLNVGCSPPDYPTEQWIACHKDRYMTSAEDEILVTARCKSGAAAAGGGAARWAAVAAAGAAVAAALLL